MESAINTSSQWACNGLNNLVNSDSFFKRHIQSRVAAPFVAVPLTADVVANLAVGAVKAVLAPFAKVLEIAAAFFGKVVNLGNFACEAANHLGKAVAGLVAAAFTVTVGVLYPAATVAACRALGLAAAPASAQVVGLPDLGELEDDIEYAPQPEPAKEAPKASFVEKAKAFFAAGYDMAAEKLSNRKVQIGLGTTAAAAVDLAVAYKMDLLPRALTPEEALAAAEEELKAAEAASNAANATATEAAATYVKADAAAAGVTPDCLGNVTLCTEDDQKLFGVRDAALNNQTATAEAAAILASAYAAAQEKVAAFTNSTAEQPAA